MCAKKIELAQPLDAEKITVRKDHYFPNAYIIDFPLDSEPDHVWQDIFESEWKSSRHLWDRKVFVIGDKLRLVTAPYDIEEKISWVLQIIENTNRKVEDYNKKVKWMLQVKSEAREASVQHDMAIEKIRETLRIAFQR